MPVDLEDGVRPGPRTRIEQGERRGVRVVDRRHAAHGAERIRARRHEGGGVLPQLRLLVAHPERLEHRVGRVEVRADVRVELLRRHRLGERGRLVLGPTIHPDHRGTHRTPAGVADDHPVKLRSERQSLDRRRAFRHLGDEPGHRPFDRADPEVGILLGPRRIRERQVVRLVRGRHQRAVGGVQRGVRSLAPNVATDDVRAAHGMITIFRPAPDRMVSNASPICSNGKRCVTTPCRSSRRRSR